MLNVSHCPLCRPACVQEVPKNANRIPSATFFLLSHNKVRCVDKMRFTLLSTLNKTMSRRRSTIGRHTKFLDKVRGCEFLPLGHCWRVECFLAGLPIFLVASRLEV